MVTAYRALPNADGSKPVAAVTGASSGFGQATARLLAEAGFEVVVGARRKDRVDALAKEIGGRSHHLDVTDLESITAFAAALPRLNVLVNNAGGALGMEPLAEADDEHWRAMWESNVFGLMRMTRGCLPALQASGQGHIVNVGSIAGTEAYPNGAGYTTAKHAVNAITRTLRAELLGKRIRVTEVSPGLSETEFSLVRFAGDVERAKKPYEGVDPGPLVAQDVADCIAWVVTRPFHVNVDYMRVTPVAQLSATIVHRGPLT